MTERAVCDSCELPVTDTYMVQETVAGERVTLCEVCRRLIKLGLIKGPE